MFAFDILFAKFILFAALLHGMNNAARAEDCAEDVVCPRIVSRLAWGARDAQSENNFPSIPKFVVICHTVTEKCRNLATCSSRVRAMQNYHIDVKHWDDISYNFMIGEDGAVYEGRGWDYVGAHTSSYNEKSIGIAFIGDFQNRLPNSGALKAAKDLIKCGKSKGKIPQDYKLVAHRQVTSTMSPGQKLADEIKSWPRWTSNLTEK